MTARLGRGNVVPQQLLGEIDDLLRTLPEPESYRTPETGAWLGRSQAVVAAWSRVEAVPFIMATDQLTRGVNTAVNWRTVSMFLYRVRHDLVLETTDASTRVVSKGEPFGYFDEVRKIVQRARTELFFVDPYLTDEFVARYLPSVAAGTHVRLLGRDSIAKLIPAVEMFQVQSGLTIDVRSGSGFHDRFLFLDRTECYQSSASFHQGGKTTPAVLTPMLDAAATLLQVYDTIWASGK